MKGGNEKEEVREKGGGKSKKANKQKLVKNKQNNP